MCFGPLWRTLLSCNIQFNKTTNPSHNWALFWKLYKSLEKDTEENSEGNRKGHELSYFNLLHYSNSFYVYGNTKVKPQQTLVNTCAICNIKSSQSNQSFSEEDSLRPVGIRLCTRRWCECPSKWQKTCSGNQQNPEYWTSGNFKSFMSCCWGLESHLWDGGEMSPSFTPQSATSALRRSLLSSGEGNWQTQQSSLSLAHWPALSQASTVSAELRQSESGPNVQWLRS